MERELTLWLLPHPPLFGLLGPSTLLLQGASLAPLWCPSLNVTMKYTMKYTLYNIYIVDMEERRIC